MTKLAFSFYINTNHRGERITPAHFNGVAKFSSVKTGDYGNGTYLYIELENPSWSEYMYDLRYDTEYQQEKEFEYLLNWIESNWGGRAFSIEIEYL